MNKTKHTEKEYKKAISWYKENNMKGCADECKKQMIEDYVRAIKCHVKNKCWDMARELIEVVEKLEEEE